MVVQGILALALALPTGLLFGVGYGTGVRIGYEQVYPLLFPKDSANRNVTPTVNNIKQINGIYNAIGGKEASQMGIAMGLQGAMEEIDRNPDFQALEALELRLSGRTQSRSGTEAPLKEISISDFPSDSSANPNSPKYNYQYHQFILKQQGKLPTIQERKELQNAPFPEGFDFGNKEQLLPQQPSAKVLSASKDPIYLSWITTLGQLKAQFTGAKTEFIRMKGQSNTKLRDSFWVKMLSVTKKIRLMSNDYRDTNNHIRENAIRLRQELANQQWIRQYSWR